MKKLFETLQPGTKRWINAIRKEFSLESHHDKLLCLAGASWDRILQSREQVRKEGCYVQDRFGQAKEHPGLTTERQSMIVYLRVMREVGLDLEPPGEVRTPRQYGG